MSASAIRSGLLSSLRMYTACLRINLELERTKTTSYAVAFSVVRPANNTYFGRQLLPPVFRLKLANVAMRRRIQ